MRSPVGSGRARSLNWSQVHYLWAEMIRFPHDYVAHRIWNLVCVSCLRARNHRTGYRTDTQGAGGNESLGVRSDRSGQYVPPLYHPVAKLVQHGEPILAN